MNNNRRKCTAKTAYSGTPCRRQTTPIDRYCTIHKNRKTLKTPDRRAQIFKTTPTHPAQIN